MGGPARGGIRGLGTINPECQPNSGQSQVLRPDDAWVDNAPRIFHSFSMRNSVFGVVCVSVVTLALAGCAGGAQQSAVPTSRFAGNGQDHDDTHIHIKSECAIQVRDTTYVPGSTGWLDVPVEGTRKRGEKFDVNVPVNILDPDDRNKVVFKAWVHGLHPNLGKAWIEVEDISTSGSAIKTRSMEEFDKPKNLTSANFKGEWSREESNTAYWVIWIRADGTQGCLRPNYT